MPHSIGTPQEPRVIVKKYTQTGTEPWTKELNLGGNLAPTSILSDGNTGIYVSGYAWDPILGDTGWLKKFNNTNGVELFSQTWD
ncbi:hypothetical protein [Leptospira santarosai]|uniref:hypothetical protein n=1 Tax=Leptospira santarosai TaxID=28183 RepID=UPI0003653D03|nr:hypothetical protein [Leptospira santarosai]